MHRSSLIERASELSRVHKTHFKETVADSSHTVHAASKHNSAKGKHSRGGHVTKPREASPVKVREKLLAQIILMTEPSVQLQARPVTNEVKKSIALQSVESRKILPAHQLRKYTSPVVHEDSKEKTVNQITKSSLQSDLELLAVSSLQSDSELLAVSSPQSDLELFAVSSLQSDLELFAVTQAAPLS